jgi:DNA-binding IclR family transcriptional regulator
VTPQKSTSGTQSIERAIALLCELATFGPDGAKVSELASRLCIEYPTVHRMVRSLVTKRMVEKSRQRGRYTLGPLVYELGLSVPRRMNLREKCEGCISRLAEITGDTVFLNVRSGYDVLCIDRKEGAFPIKTLIFEIGNRRPLGIGAGGIALLMHLGDDELEHIIHDNTERLKALGYITAKNVLARVRHAREQGHVFTEDIVIRGVSAVSIPFGGHHGLPCAAISIASIPSRMPPSRQSELVRLLKNEITTLENIMTNNGAYMSIAA